jgi:hypothetical protein
MFTLRHSVVVVERKAMFESQKTKDLREKLLAEVYTDEEKFVRAIAEKHTVMNLGQNWPEETYNRLRSEAESDEVHDAIVQEYKSWLKDAKKECAMIKKANLPLTLANAELAFSKKGPFAKQA